MGGYLTTWEEQTTWGLGRAALVRMRSFVVHRRITTGAEHYKQCVPFSGGQGGMKMGRHFLRAGWSLIDHFGVFPKEKSIQSVQRWGSVAKWRQTYLGKICAGFILEAGKIVWETIFPASATDPHRCIRPAITTFVPYGTPPSPLHQFACNANNRDIF